MLTFFYPYNTTGIIFYKLNLLQAKGILFITNNHNTNLYTNHISSNTMGIKFTKKTLQMISATLLFLVLVLTSFTWADTNGVWHRAEDVRAGTFGADENPSNDYTFGTDVQISGEIHTNNIKSGSGDDIVIRLG